MAEGNKSSDGKTKRTRKPSGPKTLFVLYGGPKIEGGVKITRRADEAMDALTGDRDLNVEKVVIPAGR